MELSPTARPQAMQNSYNLYQRMAYVTLLTFLLPLIPFLFICTKTLVSRMWEIITTGKVNHRFETIALTKEIFNSFSTYLKEHHMLEDFSLTITGSDNILYKVYIRRRGSGGYSIEIQNSQDPNDKFSVRSNADGTLEDSSIFQPHHRFGKNIARFSQIIQQTGVSPASLTPINQDSLKLLAIYLKNLEDPLTIADQNGSPWDISKETVTRNGFHLRFHPTLNLDDSTDSVLAFDNFGNIAGITIAGLASERKNLLACIFVRLQSRGAIASLAQNPSDFEWDGILPQLITSYGTQCLPTGECLSIRASRSQGAFELVLQHGSQQSVFQVGANGKVLSSLTEEEKALMNKFFNVLLKEHGISVNGSEIKVHPLAIKQIPEFVLEKISPLLDNLANVIIKWLDNRFQDARTIDAGGPKKELVCSLGEALFSTHNRDNREARIQYQTTENDAAIIPIGDANNPTCPKFGCLLKSILTFNSSNAPNKLLLGCQLSSNWLQWSKWFVEGGAENIISRLPNLDLFSKSALRFYFQLPRANKENAQQYLTNIMGLDSAPEDDEELRTAIKDNCPYVSQIEAILQIFTPNLPIPQMQRLSSGEAIAANIQLPAITVERILEALQEDTQFPLTGPIRTTFLTRLTWLREIIEEHRDDPSWLSRFVKLITGRVSLVPGEILKISKGYQDGVLPQFAAHTCFNRLDIPLSSDVSNKAHFETLLNIAIDLMGHSAG